MCKRVLKNLSSVLCGYKVSLALAHHPEDLPFWADVFSGSPGILNPMPHNTEA